MDAGASDTANQVDLSKYRVPAEELEWRTNPRSLPRKFPFPLQADDFVPGMEDLKQQLDETAVTGGALVIYAGGNHDRHFAEAVSDELVRSLADYHRKTDAPETPSKLREAAERLGQTETAINVRKFLQRKLHLFEPDEYRNGSVQKVEGGRFDAATYGKLRRQMRRAKDASQNVIFIDGLESLPDYDLWKTVQKGVEDGKYRLVAISYSGSLPENAFLPRLRKTETRKGPGTLPMEEGARKAAMWIEHLGVCGSVDIPNGTKAAIIDKMRQDGDRRDVLRTNFADYDSLVNGAITAAKMDGRTSVSTADVRRAAEADEGPARKEIGAFERRRPPEKLEPLPIGSANGLCVYRNTLDDAEMGGHLQYHVLIDPNLKGQVKANLERGPLISKDKYFLPALESARMFISSRYPELLKHAGIEVAIIESYNLSGDSASAVLTATALLAAAGIEADPSVAGTGAIDPRGLVADVGGVTAKAQDGWFDYMSAVREGGATVSVVLPKGNVPDLMLRKDVIDDIRKGALRVYGVETVEEMAEVLSGGISYAEIDRRIQEKIAYLKPKPPATAPKPGTV